MPGMAYDQYDQGYWLPVDSVPQDPSNWISNTEITNTLRAIQARHVMVVADSCYSGSLTRDANVEIRDANYLTRIVQKKARTVMTSGGLEPVSDKGTRWSRYSPRPFLRPGKRTPASSMPRLSSRIFAGR